MALPLLVFFSLPLCFHSMASNLLGNSIVVGSPFSQMTSSSSINGNVMKTVQLAMPVEGTSQKGIVSVEVRLPQF